MNYSKTEIEDALIAVLAPLHSDQGGDVRKIAGYQGELDSENLTQFVIQFPAILVAFAGSAYKMDAYPYMIEELTYTILIADRNMRGNEAARKGAPRTVGTYTLMRQVRQLLHGKRLDLSMATSDPLTIVREVALVNTKTVSIYSAEYLVRQKIRE